MNLLSKLTKDPKGAHAIALSKNLVLRVILYFNKEVFPFELVLHCIRVLHNCCKSALDFRGLCLESHGFTLKSFDGCVRDSLAIFNECLQKGDWDNFTNICSIVSALTDCFPERAIDF